MSIPSSVPGQERRERGERWERERWVRQESLVGQTLCNDEYYIQRVIGHGGMGKVFLASHSELAVPLAIKQARADSPLPESVIAELDYVLQGGDLSKRPAKLASLEFPSSGGSHTDRFLREALFLARLRHPALPTLYDYFLEDAYWYLVMDYIPGPTLTEYLREQGVLPPLEALNYAMQLCDVFDYLHKQSPPIIFRDLKPSNIIVTPTGTLMLVDFGIARYFKDGQNNDTTDFGSPGYASPEQYQTEGQTDARSDLFSLGVLLHEMVSGERPKAPGAFTGVMGAMQYTARQLNPTVSSSLSGLIALATRTEPMYRFQSAHTFYLALERSYMLEEQRTYQQRVLLEQAIQQEHEHIEDRQQGDVSGIHDALANAVALPSSPSTQSATQEATGQVYLPDSAQRRVIRETLQQMRRERLAEDELESQLSEVDEGLVRRTSMSLTQIPALPRDHKDEEKRHKQEKQERKSDARQEAQLPSSVSSHVRERNGTYQTIGHATHTTDATHTTRTTRSTPCVPFSYSIGIRRFIRVSFIVVLIIFLVLASLTTYVRLSHHPLTLSRGTGGPASRTTIPAQVSTPTLGVVSTNAGVWQQLPSFDSPEADNTAVYVRVQGRDYIYVNGGYRGPEQSPHYDHHLYRYDIAAAQWQTLSGSQFPGMVNNAVATDASGRIYYVAGYSSDTYSIASLLYIYQPTSGILQKIVPPSNVSLGYGGSMIADASGHLYITQGFPKSGDVAAGTGWYRYDTATGQWHTLAPLPAGLGYVILALDADGSILLIGGARDAGQQQQSTTMYRYSVTTNSWQQETTNAPVALSGAASTLVQPGRLVTTGGYDAVHKQGQAQTWLVDLHTLHWTPLARLPFGGSVMGAAASDGNGHVYLVRGASDLSKPTPDFWLLTI